MSNFAFRFLAVLPGFLIFPLCGQSVAATGIFIDPPASFVDEQHKKVFELMGEFADREFANGTKEISAKRDELLKTWKLKQENAIKAGQVTDVIALSKAVKQLEAGDEVVTVPASANSLERGALEEYNRFVQGVPRLKTSTRLSSAQKYGSYLVKQKKKLTQEDKLKDALKYEAEIKRVLADVNAMKTQLGIGAKDNKGEEKKDERKKAEIPDGAVEFDDNYYFVFNEKLSWTAAQARCENVGGKLVVANTKRKQEFVARLAPKSERLWIGLRKQGRTWKWINGDSVVYKSWGSRHPVSVVGADFGAIYYGRWYSVADSLTTIDGFICEWDAILLR